MTKHNTICPLVFHEPTGHKTEAVYRRYAIVSSGDLADAARKRNR